MHGSYVKRLFKAESCGWAQVLSLMLGQAGLHLHTFPEVAFRLDKWTMQGYPSVLDKTPNRQLDIHVSPASLSNIKRAYYHSQTMSAIRIPCKQRPSGEEGETLLFSSPNIWTLCKP